MEKRPLSSAEDNADEEIPEAEQRALLGGSDIDVGRQGRDGREGTVLQENLQIQFILKNAQRQSQVE